MALPPYELDVRPILKNGGEPFQAIIQAVQALQPGQPLRLLATFRPVPLFQVMAGRGFDHIDREIDGGDWEVLFMPKSAASEADVSDDADEPAAWPEPERYLDLADLDPPEPMVRVLAATEKMEPGEVLFALLSREPVFLFPELKKRGHQWAGNLSEDGAAYRLLVRIGPRLE